MKWAARFQKDKLRGKPLRVAVTIEDRYARRLLRHIDAMIKVTDKAIEDIFTSEDYAGKYAMDANIGSQARITMNALNNTFETLFAQIAGPISEQMIDSVDDASAIDLKMSLREIAGHYSFDTDILTGELRESLTAATQESAGLIKRVPTQYLGQIQGDVMRSIQSGRGLADLKPQLEKRNVEIRNWAHNVAMDQTRKAYAGINKGRMKALGVTKYEWVHSGGSNHPRAYHRDVLNGKIFSVDNPPIIDPKTGERGHPGTAIFCRCTMRPIVTFGDDEDDEGGE